MKILDVFKGIHSKNHSKILSVLNNAVFIDSLKLPVPTDGYHTGFTFKIHTGSEFELILALDEKNKLFLVYQFKGYRYLPMIAGLKLTRTERYFDRYYNDVWAVISSCNSYGQPIYYSQDEIIKQTLTHLTIKIYTHSDDAYLKDKAGVHDFAVLGEFPLSEQYSTPFFLADGEIYANRQEYLSTLNFEDGEF